MSTRMAPSSCASCRGTYQPRTSHQRYCSSTCSKRAEKQRRAHRDGRTFGQQAPHPCVDCGTVIVPRAQDARLKRCEPCRRAVLVAKRSRLKRLENDRARTQRAAERLVLTHIRWRPCGHCATTFAQPVNRHRTYCTARCRAAHDEPRRARAKRGRHLIRRFDVFQRDGWTCWLCDTTVRADVAAPHPLAATIDHLVPRIHGGSDDPSNLGTAHFICNSRRGDRIDVVTLPAPAAA